MNSADHAPTLKEEASVDPPMIRTLLDIEAGRYGARRLAIEERETLEAWRAMKAERDAVVQRHHANVQAIIDAVCSLVAADAVPQGSKSLADAVHGATATISNLRTKLAETQRYHEDRGRELKRLLDDAEAARDAAVLEAKQWKEALDRTTDDEAELRAKLAAAEADSKRYAWLRDRFVGADFAYPKDEQTTRNVLVLDLTDDGPVWGSLDLTVDHRITPPTPDDDYGPNDGEARTVNRSRPATGTTEGVNDA